MKKIILLTILAATISVNSQAQEKYGAVNLGVGLGYYGPRSSPALNLNVEFDVFRNFTLAPFITVQTWRDDYYGYDNVNNRNANYGYRYLYVPLGLKGTYYFDELFNAGDKWDFYAGASLGFAIRKTTWENGYSGTGYSDAYASPLYGNLHIGAEVHLSKTVGMFLDVSTGISTFGLGFHF